MPLVNGLKMACEPCIRGHRTSVCNHGKERVLIAVRKPGRPLRECPHPPGRPCPCQRQPQSVTVALPRKRKCDCIADPEKPLPGAPQSSRPRVSGASTPVSQRPQSSSPSSAPVSTPSNIVSNATVVATARTPDTAVDNSSLNSDDQSASQSQVRTPEPLQANAIGTMSQTITINLGLCGNCLSQPQQNIVFRLPSTLGQESVHIIIQLPNQQAASQGPTTTAYMGPQTFEAHHSTNTMAPVPTPAPQATAQRNSSPQRQMASSAMSLGGECSSDGCNCGPLCQCIGCVVHPYNSATKDFIFSAYQDVLDFPDRQGQGQLWDSQPSVLSTTPPVESVTSGVDVRWPVDPQLMSSSRSLYPVAEDVCWNDDFLLVNYPNRTADPSALDLGLTERCTRRLDCCCVDCVIHCVQANSASDTPG